MKILDLIYFLFTVLVRHGNLPIRFFSEGKNFPLSINAFEVGEWEDKKELFLE